MIESELYTALQNDATLTALISNRVYPVKAPQNVVRPYVVYFNASAFNNQCMGGNVYQTSNRFQIDCIAETYSQSINVRNAVIGALSSFKLQDVSHQDLLDDETGLYRQLIDFIIKD